MKRLFLTTVAVNGANAVFNLLGTILLVRWFGTSVYADYLVDLSYLSLLSIVLEIVPSNYSVFRVQDDPARIYGLGALAIVSAVGLAVVVQISGWVFTLFHAHSLWIPLYAGLLAVKRYLDIRLQSTGRLREFCGIELRSAVIRIVLLTVFLWWAVQPTDAIWASLAGATLLAQLSWFVQHRDEGCLFISCFNRSLLVPLVEERWNYVPYYAGTGIKRLRDNLVPILANSFFISREALGAFLLVYRGLLFTLGQIRIIETILNHRHTLAAVLELPFFHRVLLATVGQVICIAATVVLIVVSSVETLPFLTILLLSVIVWPYVFSILERTKAYSSYDTRCVNSAMVAYCVSAGGLAWLFLTLNLQNPSTFSLALIGAEGLSLSIMYLLARTRASAARGRLTVRRSADAA